MKTKLTILALTILLSLSSCSVTSKVVTRQKELMALHKEKIKPKKPIKKSLKRKRQAFAITVVVGLIWLNALNHYGSGDTN
jgi:hypothetical protein